MWTESDEWHFLFRKCKSQLQRNKLWVVYRRNKRMASSLVRVRTVYLRHTSTQPENNVKLNWVSDRLETLQRPKLCIDKGFTYITSKQFAKQALDAWRHVWWEVVEPPLFTRTQSLYFFVGRWWIAKLFRVPITLSAAWDPKTK